MGVGGRDQGWSSLTIKDQHLLHDVAQQHLIPFYDTLEDDSWLTPLYMVMMVLNQIPRCELSSGWIQKSIISPLNNIPIWSDLAAGKALI